MELLFVSDQLVSKSRFITFEVDWASKYAKVGEAGFAAITVVEGSCGISILISNILCRASIDNLDCIGMSMVKEGTSKSGSVEQSVCNVVDFSPFGFTNSIHFLMFRGCSFNFDSKIGAS